MRSPLSVFITLLCLILSSTLRAADAGPEYTEPLGIGMEEWKYPYPVQFLELTIERQPVRMAYMDVKPTANANGKTVLLLHGKNFFGAYWQNTIEALAAAGYRVVVPDQIGFGKSSKPNIHYSFDVLAENTAKMLEQLQLDRVSVVGHSMGGMLAVRFVRNYPQRVNALILENPIGLEDYRMKVPPQSMERAYLAETGKTTQQIRDYLKLYFVQWKPQYEQFVEAPARIKLSSEFARWATASALTSEMIYQQPVRHEFSLITAPTLLVIGQSDRTTIGRGIVSQEVLATLGNYPQLGRAAAKDIPNSKLVELENCGHIPHLEMPDRFHGALLEFLSEKN